MQKIDYKKSVKILEGGKIYGYKKRKGDKKESRR